jgi:hypothetical protein
MELQEQRDEQYEFSDDDEDSGRTERRESKNKCVRRGSG